MRITILVLAVIVLTACGRETGGGLALHCPVVGADGMLPRDYTGDGDGVTPPLEWEGAPAATASYAVIMHHLDPEGRTKWYWVLYNIPASVRSLPRDVRNVGTMGTNSVTHGIGYAPPHSKGPGAKTYIITVYALSAAPRITISPDQVGRAELLKAMEGSILASAKVLMVYTRPVGSTGAAPAR